MKRSIRNKSAEYRTAACPYVIRAVLFLLLLFLLLNRSQNTLIRKASACKLDRFFQEDAGFDVLFTGISHNEVGIFPMELWNEYGIASFNLAESGCNLPFAYWTLRNALDYSSPKLVVIDVRHIDYGEMHYRPFARTTLERFPLTSTKLQSILELFPDFDNRISMIFPVITYHDRWKVLTEDDFLVTKRRIDNGALHYSGKELNVYTPKTNVKEVPADKKVKGNDYSLNYLRRMIEYCLSHNMAVLLTELPFPASGRDQKLANGIQDIADEYGINYLNFHHVSDIVDYQTDFSNKTHVNDSGAQKITSYLGKYIKDHYTLPDRRTDSAYEKWHTQFEAYTNYKFDRIRSQNHLEKYLMLLADRNTDVYIQINKDSAILKNELYIRLLMNIYTAGDLPALSNITTGQDNYQVFICNSKGYVNENTDTAAFYKEISVPSSYEIVLSPEEGTNSTMPDISIQVFNPTSGKTEDYRSFDSV